MVEQGDVQLKHIRPNSALSFPPTSPPKDVDVVDSLSEDADELDDIVESEPGDRELLGSDQAGYAVLGRKNSETEQDEDEETSDRSAQDEL